jgi:hypothetical protein
VTKLKGNVRIAYTAPSEKAKPVFEVHFAPYVSRLKTQPIQFRDEADLVDFLFRIKVSDDDVSRWVGKVKVEGLVLIPEIQLTEQQLRENGLVL